MSHLATTYLGQKASGTATTYNLYYVPTLKSFEVIFKFKLRSIRPESKFMRSKKFQPELRLKAYTPILLE